MIHHLHIMTSYPYQDYSAVLLAFAIDPIALPIAYQAHTILIFYRSLKPEFLKAHLSFYFFILRLEFSFENCYLQLSFN